MSEDGFNNIEDFLKFEGNAELQLFSTFEQMTSDLIDQRFKNKSKKGFIELHQLILECFQEYEKTKSSVMKDFSITIIVSKKVLEMLNNPEISSLFTEEQKQMYLDLLKVLMVSLKKEVENTLNYFEVCGEYIDGVINILHN